MRVKFVSVKVPKRDVGLKIRRKAFKEGTASLLNGELRTRQAVTDSRVSRGGGSSSTHFLSLQGSCVHPRRSPPCRDIHSRIFTGLLICARSENFNKVWGMAIEVNGGVVSKNKISK